MLLFSVLAWGSFSTPKLSGTINFHISTYVRPTHCISACRAIPTTKWDHFPAQH